MKKILLGFLAACAVSVQAQTTPLSLTNGTSPGLTITTSPVTQSIINELTSKIPPIGKFKWTNLVFEADALESSGKWGMEGALLYNLRDVVKSDSWAPLFGVGAMYQPATRHILIELANVTLQGETSFTVLGWKIPVVGYIYTAASYDTSTFRHGSPTLGNISGGGSYTYTIWTKSGRTVSFYGFGKVIATSSPSDNQFIAALSLWGK